MTSFIRNHLVLLFITFMATANTYGQDIPNPRPLKMEEYEKAKGFIIKDLDAETYAKFENMYILDRYEMRKPYFITGDDGLKKRMDLYNLIAKDGMQQLGILIFYTNEQNTQYKALLPNFTADAKVWERYFEDIHAIDKVEKNFVLKVSYVLSKELGYQVYKSLNQGKDLSKESATYGNDICFPGDQLVTLADGSTKLMEAITVGDAIMTLNTESNIPTTVKVKNIFAHEARNYALTRLTLLKATESASVDGFDIRLSVRILKATPNHPMRTSAGDKAMRHISVNDQVLCFQGSTNTFEYFEVIDTTEIVEGVRKVYSLEGSEDSPVMMNGVMVLQK